MSPDQKFTEMVGTVPYMSPNMILGRYGHQTDYWSLGVILCLLLTGSEPFEGENDEELKKNIVCKKLNLIFEADPWKSISVEAKDLLCGLLEKKEDKRFSADDVLCKLLSSKNLRIFSDLLSGFQPIPGFNNMWDCES